MCVNGSFLAGLVSSQTLTVTLANPKVSNSQLLYSLIYLVIKVHRRKFQFFRKFYFDSKFEKYLSEPKFKSCLAKEFYSAALLWSQRSRVTSGNRHVSHSQLENSLISLVIKVHDKNFATFQFFHNFLCEGKFKSCGVEDFFSAIFCCICKRSSTNWSFLCDFRQISCAKWRKCLKCAFQKWVCVVSCIFRGKRSG